MGARERMIALSAGGVRTWLHFSLGIVLLFGISTSIDLANTVARGSLGAQALSSVVFALKLVPGAAGAGMMVWLVIRLLRGKFAAPDFRDSVLWSAYLIAALVLMMRLMR